MYKLSTPPDNSDHRIGSLSAKVILVEYGDYECPHSTKSYAWIKMLTNEFKNNLCYIYRHFPLNVLHPHSALAAAAAEAAGANNLFWEMHHLLYSRTEMLTLDGILSMAEKLGLNMEEFVLNLDRDDLNDRVNTHVTSGEKSNVISTPVFFINSMRMEGPLSYEILRENIMKISEGQSLSA